MNSLSFLKTLFVLSAVIALVTAGNSVCQFTCDSNCLKVLDTTNPSPGRYLVTVSAALCKGARVSWIQCQNAGCAVISCDGNTGVSGQKCDNVLSAVFSFNTALDSRGPVFLMHDGAQGGTFDCASAGMRNCGGGCQVNGQDPISHVCLYNLAFSETPECTIDSDCRPNGVNGLCDIVACRNGQCIHTPQSSLHVCRASAGPCELASKCNGVSPDCPATNAFRPNTYVCRPALVALDGSICDVQEKCTGNSAACPRDEFKEAGALCRAAPDSSCLPASCTGDSPSCPPNDCTPECQVASDCPASLGVCDEPTCEDNKCKHNYKPNTEICRASAGDCDVAEHCTGNSYDCPADSFKLSTHVCRPAVYECDIEEKCTGSSAACPIDRVYAAETTCRPATGDCSEPAKCDGVNTRCPPNPLKTAGTICRPKAYGTDGTTCDLEERCDGSSATCPDDNVHAAAGIECRPSVGDCDVAEVCNGHSKTCPCNGFKSHETDCISIGTRADGTTCDVSLKCTGNSATCPSTSCPNTCGVNFYGCCRPYGPGGINEVEITPSNDCGFPNFERDTRYCQRYYICSNGQRVQMDCPFATHADGQGNCVWPEQDLRACEDIPPAPSAEAPDYSACLDPEHKLGRLTGDNNDPRVYYYCDTWGYVWTGYCPENKFFHVDHQRCEWEPATGLCNDLDYKPAASCESFFQCSNGAWLLRPCPTGMDWDQVNKVCVVYDPERTLDYCTHTYNHDSPPVSCNEGERKAHETNCEDYYECTNGVWVSHECDHMWKFDPTVNYCKIRGQVERQCETKYPDACSDGDKMSDVHKCHQFFKCEWSQWVKYSCCDNYYDDAQGICNSQANVIAIRPECATTDNTIDSDAQESNDCLHQDGSLTLAQKYPSLSDFKMFTSDQKDLVKYVTHNLSPADCSSAWEPSPHPFECHKWLNCQGAEYPIQTCPPGTNWMKSPYGWGGWCDITATCGGYCGDPISRHIPFSFNEVATRTPPCDGPCTCAINDAIVSTFDADDNDNDQFTFCVNHVEYRVYCCEGTVLNPVTARCVDRNA